MLVVVVVDAGMWVGLVVRKMGRGGWAFDGDAM